MKGRCSKATLLAVALLVCPGNCVIGQPQTSSPPPDATIIGPGETKPADLPAHGKADWQPAAEGTPKENAPGKSATIPGAQPGEQKPAADVVGEAKQHNRAGITLQTQGKLPAAIEEYRKAIKLNPDSAAYHNNLALALKDMQLLDEAQREAAAAIKLSPDRGDYYFNLGLVLEKLDRLTLASNQFRKAISLNTHDFEARYHLGDVLMQLSRPVQAEKEIRQALDLGANEPRFHRLLADALMDEGKNNQALSEYKLVLTLSPRAVDNHQVINRIQFLEHNLQLGSRDKSKWQ